MARVVRADVFDPREVSVFHCINRCVRKCFLCGRDAATGRDYEHRKTWLEDRLRFLAGCFGIDVLGFSVMDNHFHVILRNRPDVVETWSDEEAARRWYRLCPVRKTASGEPEEPTAAELSAIVSDLDRLAEIRLRLSHISWFMRFAAESVARRANREDGCPGRFWQGRFKAVKLCDEAAILACSVYVDLNPIRAGLCRTPEASEHTSARLRIEEAGTRRAHPAAAPPRRTQDEWLAPLPLDERPQPGPAPSTLATRASDKGFLPLPLADYLELLDWTGRQAVSGKRGSIPARLAPILSRLAIPTESWVDLSLGFGKLFHRVAGCPAAVHSESHRAHRRFRAPGARLLAPPCLRRE
jgi:REP element-mobilizing transposase RayT